MDQDCLHSSTQTSPASLFSLKALSWKQISNVLPFGETVQFPQLFPSENKLLMVLVLW